MLLHGDPTYLRILEGMKTLHINKNAGYAGDHNDAWINFRMSEKFGVPAFLGVLVRMSDKKIRIDNLVANPTNERVGESIVDTLSDLAAYALIAVCVWRERKMLQRVKKLFTGRTAGAGDPTYLALLDSLRHMPTWNMTWPEVLADIDDHFQRLVDVVNRSNAQSPLIPAILIDLATRALNAICIYQEMSDVGKEANGPGPNSD